MIFKSGKGWGPPDASTHVYCQKATKTSNGKKKLPKEIQLYSRGNCTQEKRIRDVNISIVIYVVYTLSIFRSNNTQYDQFTAHPFLYSTAWYENPPQT